MNLYNFQKLMDPGTSKHQKSLVYESPINYLSIQHTLYASEMKALNKYYNYYYNNHI